MKKQIVRTQWFPQDVKPVHPGFYERDYKSPADIAVKDRWDGTRWIVYGFFGAPIGPSNAKLPWRGIARGRGRPPKSA